MGSWLDTCPYAIDKLTLTFYITSVIKIGRRRGSRAGPDVDPTGEANASPDTLPKDGLR
jgi:hypothetical protein